MRKLFTSFIEAIFWLQFFFSPLLIAALIGFVIYISNEELLWLSIIIAIAGLITGIAWAERVRKRHGTSRHASTILGTPDEAYAPKGG